MIRFVSKASTGLYRHGIKPILFRTQPDTAHTRLLRLGGVVQKLHLMPLIACAWKYRNKDYLSQNINGIRFKNPVGLAAGFDKNIELVHLLRSVGFGFMTGGSVTDRPCEGNPRPWFHRLPKSKSLVVHAGLANQGATAIRSRLMQYRPKHTQDFPLIVSVAKTNDTKTATDKTGIADYVGGLRKLRGQSNIAAFELNISCPNAYGGEPFTTPERLDALLAAVDAFKLKQPLFIKMPINLPWRETDALLAVIVEHNVQGVTIGNLHKKRSDLQLDEPLPADVPGGLSGLPTQALSDKLIAATYRAYGDKLVIIGVGGIFTAEDAYRKICLGASLVELITGVIFEGPQLIGQINHDIVKLLKQDGFTNITEAIGSKNSYNKA